MKKSIHIDFFYLFTKREAKVLMGKYWLNLIFLIFILFLTYFAIGFGKGTLAYLKLKMEDPFIQLVEVRTSYEKIDQIEEIIKQIDTEELQTRYGYSSIEGYTSFSMDFYQSTDHSKNEMMFIGRTIENDNSLLKKILLPENRIVGRDYMMPDDQAVIVTKKMVTDLGYSTDSIPHFLHYSYYCGGRQPVPLPVLAVVENLPSEYNFLVTSHLKDQIDSQEFPLNICSEEQNNSLVLFVGSENIAKSLRDWMTGEPTLSEECLAIDITKYNKSYERSFIVECLFKDSVKENFVKDFIANKTKELAQFSAIRIFNFTKTDFSRQSRIIDHFTVFFEDLSRTTDFREFMLTEHKMMVDLNQVKAKENYAFIQNISNSTSWFLIFLSIISICLFISNLLKNHIEKLKINLGTFKAFGLNNLALIVTYSFIVIALIILSQIIGAGISYLFGNTISKTIITLSGIEPESGIDYFNILTYFSLKVTLFVLFISFLVILFVLRSKLTETPGNLIYNRSNKS